MSQTKEKCKCVFHRAHVVACCLTFVQKHKLISSRVEINIAVNVNFLKVQHVK